MEHETRAVIKTLRDPPELMRTFDNGFRFGDTPMISKREERNIGFLDGPSNDWVELAQALGPTGALREMVPG